MRIKAPGLFIVILIFCQGLSPQSLPIWKDPPQKLLIDEHFPIVYQQDVSSQITIVQILVKGGKKWQPLGLSGIAYLTSRLALEPPDSGKVRTLLKLGSAFSWQVEGDFALMTVKCLSLHLEETLEIMTAILADPLFSSLRIVHLKEQMEFQQKGQLDDPAAAVSQAVTDAFFTVPGYGGSVFGTEDSLKRIKRKDVEDFYEKYFNRANMAVAVTTDLAADEIRRLMKSHFVKIPTGTPPPEVTAKTVVPGKREIVIVREREQVLIAYAAPVPPLDRDNFVLAMLLEDLLAKGAGSRLWRLRAESKLAYTVDAQLNQMQDGGTLQVYLKTAQEKSQTALAALKEEMLLLFKGGISEEELQMTKIHTRADFLRRSETKESRALNLAFFEACGLGYRFLEDIFSALDAVTLRQMNRFIKQVLHPDRLLLVTAGPRSQP